MKGIDISNYQTSADYTRIKNSGIEAAYIKVSEGQGYKDVQRNNHYNGLKSVGLPVGFYHFFHPTTNPIEQAQNFADSISGMKADLIHMCDIEVTEGQDSDTISRRVKVFCDKVKELTGIDCGVYTGSSFSKSYLTTELRGTKLWLAHYTSGQPSWNTDVWDRWSGWQYTSNGSVNGLFGNIDMDNFNDDLLISGCRTYTPPQPSGVVNGVNATVVNDWFYTRDAQGNQEEGHQVNIGDNIRVIDVSYSRQLDLVEYPVPGGTRQAYIRNVASNIAYKYQGQWRNGSTSEPVYQDASCSYQIGTIDPYECATPLYRQNGILAVVYNTDKGNNSKSGFVKYNSGFTVF